MLLGIYAFPNFRGLRVLDTMPAYSAHGRLFRNDVVSRVTVDGVSVYPTRSFQQFEFAKDRIGPNTPAALEVFRPGQGYIYLWVEFVPVGGPALQTLRSGAPAAAPMMKARVMTEKEKPGAARLFNGRNKGPGAPKAPRPRRRINTSRAANLFGR
jgi:hypothetical protein